MIKLWQALLIISIGCALVPPIVLGASQDGHNLEETDDTSHPEVTLEAGDLNEIETKARNQVGWHRHRPHYHHRWHRHHRHRPHWHHRHRPHFHTPHIHLKKLEKIWDKVKSLGGDMRQWWEAWESSSNDCKPGKRGCICVKGDPKKAVDGGKHADFCCRGDMNPDMFTTEFGMWGVKSGHAIKSLLSGKWAQEVWSVYDCYNKKRAKTLGSAAAARLKEQQQDAREKINAKVASLKKFVETLPKNVLNKLKAKAKAKTEILLDDLLEHDLEETSTAGWNCG
jgi:hypothetical protein